MSPQSLSPAVARRPRGVALAVLAVLGPLALALSFVSTPPAAAEGSVQQAYLSEALVANPEVAAAYETYLAATRRGTQVRALEEPMLSYSEYLSGSGMRMMGFEERSLMISQALPWPGVLKRREHLADAEARVAYYRYETKRREVIERVGLASIEYAYLKVATERAAENLELLRQLQPVVEEKVRGGESLGLSLRLEVEVALAEQDLSSLREQRPGLDAQLRALLGRAPADTPLPWPALPGSAPALPELERVRGDTKRHHPALHGAEAGIEAARRGEALAETSRRPSLSLGAEIMEMGGGETAGAVMLGVKLPIRREKYRAEREEAAAHTRAAGASREAVEQALLASAAERHAEQREAAQRLSNYRNKLIPAARQAVELTQEDFRNDRASLTDLIETERTLLDLRLMQARALADAHKAAWRIRALTEPLPEASK